MSQNVNQNWVVYVEQFQDFEGLIRMNLALTEDAPFPSYTHRLDVKIRHQVPCDNFVSSEEKDRLYALEDTVNELVATLDVIDVGLVRCNNTTNFHYYASAEEVSKLEQALQDLLSRDFSEYVVTFNTKEDPNWELYFDILVPSPHSLREVQNLSVLNALREHGDDFSKERPISHWAFFPDQEAAEGYAAKIKAEGFEIEKVAANEESLESGDPLPYTVVCTNTQAIDTVSINDTTWFLMDVAEEFKGDYDGWETPIMPKEDKELEVK